MKLEFVKTQDKKSVEKLTLENMNPYYKDLSLEWDPENYADTWEEFETYEIKCADTTVGYFRSSTDETAFYIRDIQLFKEQQNKGIGRTVLTRAEKLAVDLGFKLLRLRVFTTNPAISLYRRCGFVTVQAGEKILGMEKEIR